MTKPIKIGKKIASTITGQKATLKPNDKWLINDRKKYKLRFA